MIWKLTLVSNISVLFLYGYLKKNEAVAFKNNGEKHQKQIKGFYKRTGVNKWHHLTAKQTGCHQRFENNLRLQTISHQ